MNNPVDTSIGAGSLRTMTAALTGPRPAAFLAPIDDTFVKIPEGDLQTVLINKTELNSVLTYGAMSSKISSVKTKPRMVKSTQGMQWTIGTLGGVMVAKAKVVAADVDGDNDFSHAIDTVVDAQATMPCAFRSGARLGGAQAKC